MQRLPHAIHFSATSLCGEESDLQSRRKQKEREELRGAAGHDNLICLPRSPIEGQSRLRTLPPDQDAFDVSPIELRSPRVTLGKDQIS